MQLVQASTAALLSDLTGHQLREWCGRRGVLPPDVRPAGRGRHALYSWQTILALRLLRQLHEQFGAEVSSWAPAIKSVRDLFRERSFPTLWDSTAIFLDKQRVTLSSEHRRDDAFVAIPLDPHLRVLASGFALPGPANQLPLLAPALLQR